MIKKISIMLALVAGFAIADMPDANAWPRRRIAPVRRILAPPYPVVRATASPRYYVRPYATGYRGGYYNNNYGYGGYGGYGPSVRGGVYLGF